MSMTHWMTGMKEQYRSLFKSSFVDSLQKLIPEVQPEDVWRPSAGVRAQAIDDNGGLLQDFKIVRGDRAVHVLNAPSPAATSSLPIGHHIADIATEAFGL